ncbi:phospholipase D/transphosphatidylase [Alcanivorax hongdengensis A-11-3]|uniref:Phospholipase D/transphosphatidylase n=1 Tax=Alcanivorax hongdengensis A-11-3 TaxID=1177179 RepID=L0WDE2_9GAMM|nr:phospholipase D family protein [Alcanivorax hongdengensis]EKF74793.1 phospholipase D/transphosphatidylase [Alcanivorax hongdengensis A-11-3]
MAKRLPLPLALLLLFLLPACQAKTPYNPADRTYSKAMVAPPNIPLRQGAEHALAGDSQQQGSGFYLLHDGLSAFVARVALIEAARSSLDLQYYIFSDDTAGRIIISKLLDAADRGVRVRLLVDDLGTRIAEPLAATLAEHPNIEIRLFNPVKSRGGFSRAWQMARHFGRANHRMHNKLMMADASVMIAGGRNLGDEYFSNTNVDFQDVDVAAIGDIVAQGSASFDRYWNSPASVPIDQVLDANDAPMDLDALRQALVDFVGRQKDSEYVRALVDSALGRKLVDGQVPLVWGQATLYADPPEKAYQREQLERDDYLGASVKRILDDTHSRLLISSAYFVPGDAGAAHLQSLSERGVAVSILTNSLSTTDVAIVHSGYASYRQSLLEGGIQLWELRSQAEQQQRMHWFKGKSRASLHAKTFVLDEDRVFIGSMNLDGRSVLQNTEVGLLIDSPELNRHLADLFHQWTAPSAAWKLRLTKDNDLQWQASDQGNAVIKDHDPETSGWQRFKVWALSLLPVESQI